MELFCSLRECVFGEHWLKEPIPIMRNGKQSVLIGSRHDQTILSILHIRHNLTKVQKSWEFYELRSLEHVQKNNSLFYNHHESYYQNLHNYWSSIEYFNIY